VEAEEKEILNRYMRSVKKHRLLTFEEEFSLGRLYKEGNQEAGNKLIVANLRLVVKTANRYTYSSISTLDLIQEGNIGLMYALRKYDPEMGRGFSTYARFWVFALMWRYMQRYTSMLSPVLESGHPLLHRCHGLFTEDGEEMDILDTMASPRSLPDEELERAEIASVVRKAVDRSVRSDSDRVVVKNRILAADPETYRQIAHRLSLSHEAIRNRESRIMKRIEYRLEEEVRSSI